MGEKLLLVANICCYLKEGRSQKLFNIFIIFFSICLNKSFWSKGKNSYVIFLLVIGFDFSTSNLPPLTCTCMQNKKPAVRSIMSFFHMHKTSCKMKSLTLLFYGLFKHNNSIPILRLSTRIYRKISFTECITPNIFRI